MARYIVFTDLDGTLLDHDTYDFTNALPGIALLKKSGIPLVFCSSKTRREQEVLRKRLGVSAPFIVEDGGAIYIDKGYFKSPVEPSSETNGYQVIVLGRPYAEIREVLKRVSRELGMAVKGFGDSTVAKIAEITGLDFESAGLAKQREYEETIVSPLTSDDASMLKRALAPFGLTLSRGGRFYAVKGENNKGAAAMKLARLFAKENRDVITVGIGDSQNDLSLLSVVYVPMLVQRRDKKWQRLSISGVKHVEGIGPVGWTRAMETLVSGTRQPSRRMGQSSF